MSKRKTSQKKTWLLLLLLLIVLPLGLIGLSNGIDKRADQETLDTLQRSVRRAAVQCYALEGFYPVNLDYLEENYGVSIDESRFYVDYQYVASNLIPDITVLSVRR